MPTPLVPTVTAVINVNSPSNEVGGIIGETITAGQVCYQKQSDAKWYKMQCDGTAAESGYAGTGSPTVLNVGMAMLGGAAGQKGFFATDGALVDTGATTAVGVFYYVGAVAGNLNPVADLVSTNYVTDFAYATNITGRLQFRIKATGLQLA